MDISNDDQSAACHECLVRAVRVMNLYVLQSNAVYRLYHAVGQSNMLESFLFECNTALSCMITTDVLPIWNLGVQVVQAIGHQDNDMHRMYVLPANDVKYHMNQCYRYAVSSMEIKEAAMRRAVSQQRNQQTEAFVRKYDSRSLIFFQNLEPPTLSNTLSDTTEEEKLLSQENDESSIRCIVIFVASKRLCAASAWLYTANGLLFGNIIYFTILKHLRPSYAYPLAFTNQK